MTYDEQYYAGQISVQDYIKQVFVEVVLEEHRKGQSEKQIAYSCGLPLGQVQRIIAKAGEGGE